MNSKDNIMQVENPQLVGREQLAVYVPVGDILNGMANDPDGRFKGDKGDKGDTGQEGPEGAGISSISVGTNNNIVIQLSNGKTYSVAIPTVKGDPGQKGDPFSISFIYNSIQEMEDSAAIDGIPEGAFVLIDTGNVNNEDNAKVFVKKGSTYSYITDMSGASGIQGPAGVSITSVVIDSDSHLKVTLSNGNVIDAGEIEAGGGGTKITVGGIEVSEWNADDKLDKVTSTATNERAYVVKANGTNEMMNISVKPEKGTIVRRGLDFPCIKVQETPVFDDDAASKKYVDNKFKSVNAIPGLYNITSSVKADSISTVPTLSFPYTTFRPTALNSVYPFIMGKLLFFVDDDYITSIDVPFGGGMYGATVYVNDPFTPQQGIVSITEDFQGNSFKMTDTDGTFVEEMVQVLEDGEIHYVEIFVQY